MIAAVDAAPLARLALQFDRRQAEVLVQPQHAVDLIQQPQLAQVVVPSVAHHLPHVRPVLLLDPGVVVLLVRT